MMDRALISDTTNKMVRFGIPARLTIIMGTGGDLLFHAVKTPLAHLRARRLFVQQPDEARIYIHVGKCGGGTLSAAIAKSGNQKRVQTFHVRKPPISQHYTYWIILRNPLARAVSAFNGAQNHMKGVSKHDKSLAEFEAFAHYQSINDIAEALYDEHEEPNTEAQRLFSQIGHIRYGIPFYLDGLLDTLHPNQIEYVFCQEFLDADIRDHLSIEGIAPVHHNGRANWQDHLSNKGAANLRRFLNRDYELIDKLHSMGKIDDERLTVLKA